MTSIPTNTFSIVIVDDDPAIRNSLSRALRIEGYHVDLFENG